ncbi:MAG: hypothetical protein AB7P37_10385 [Ramlibacter sp.]
MDDDNNQIEVPASFCALFATPAGRLTEPVSMVRQRYELCEDLAQMLVEQAATLQFKTGRPEAQVLQTIEDGLTGGDAGVSAQESLWVGKRLAELLDWKIPAGETGE